MAKTKDTIVSALTGALEHGDGDWNDLLELMERAKADIEEAKAAEEKAAAAKREAEEREYVRRGEAIAEMATRVLENKATEADIAMVMNAYLAGKSIKIQVSADDVKDAMNSADNLSKHLEILLDGFQDLLGAFVSKEKPKCEKKCTKQSADDILRAFLDDLK